MPFKDSQRFEHLYDRRLYALARRHLSFLCFVFYSVVHSGYFLQDGRARQPHFPCSRSGIKMTDFRPNKFAHNLPLPGSDPE